MKPNIIYILAISLSLSICNLAYSAMVQSLDDATSYDMFLPKDTNTPKNDVKLDPSVNYNPSIARKLFNMSDGKKRTVTITDGMTRAHVALGSRIKIVLDNIKNAQWYMEASDKLVLLNKKIEDGKIVMLFNTLQKGRANIYLDCVDQSEYSFKVIESKYINIVID